MNQNNTAIVQQAYNNFKQGNIEGILSALSEDISWELPEIKKAPFAGKRVGRKKVGEFFASLFESQEPLSFEPREFISDGDQVVSLGHYRWRVKSTDKIIDCAFAHVFTIREGKVVQFREFTDTAKAEAAYQ